MRRKRIEVTARPNCPIGDKQAKILAREVEDMYGAGIAVTKHTLLANATAKSSPIHNLFDWNDKSAGHKHRLDQAANLLGCLQIFEIRTGRPARAYYSVEIASEEKGSVKRSFHPRRVILESESARTQLSLAIYMRIKVASDEAESMGLADEDPAWKRLIQSVNSNIVRAALAAKKKEAG